MSRVRRAARDDRGVSLTELLVTMMVFGILAVIVSVVFNNTLRSVRFVSAKTSTTADTRIAMESMSRALRVALTPPGQVSAFVSVAPNSVTFYSSLARGAGQTADLPTRVTFDYVPATGCLRETQVLAVPTGVPATPLAWTGATSSKCLIRTYTAPTFEYFDDARLTQADGSAVVPLTIPAGGLTSATSPDPLKSIASVAVSLDVQDPSVTDVRGVQARDRVTLANILAAKNAGG